MGAYSFVIKKLLQAYKQTMFPLENAIQFRSSYMFRIVIMTATMLLQLPDDILTNIFKELHFQDIHNLILTCKTLCNLIINDNVLWRTKAQSIHCDSYDRPTRLILQNRGNSRYVELFTVAFPSFIIGLLYFDVTIPTRAFYPGFQPHTLHFPSGTTFCFTFMYVDFRLSRFGVSASGL